MTPPGMNEHEQNRRNDTRLGKWALAGVLIAAIVGAGAGIGGAYIGAEKQGDSQAETDRQDFLRSERKSTYADFLSQSNQLLNLTYRYAGASGADKNSLFQQNISGRQKLNQTLMQINILGPDDAYKVGKAIQDDLGTLIRNLSQRPTGSTISYNNTNYDKHVEDFITIAKRVVTG